MKPRIHIIGTGGTIAGVSRAGVSHAGVSRKQSSDELVAYDAAVLSVQALLQSLDANQLQALQERFDFTSEQLVNIDSKDMNPQVWWQLALRLHALAADGNVYSVVITHGTDTLEETSFFIEQLRQSGAFERAANMPPLNIVFTAAMRPADASDADGPQNLCDALKLAASSDAQGKGVLCLLHSRIHSAQYLSKIHSTAMDAFSSSPHSPWGELKGNAALFNKAALAEKNEISYPKLAAAIAQARVIAWPWVALVTSHAGVDARMIELLLAANVDGILIAATGNGTLSKTLIPALHEAQRKGIAVLRASRVSQGGVIAQPGDEFAASSMHSALKARIKLMLELAEKNAVYD
jgi:L-asparaginase